MKRLAVLLVATWCLLWPSNWNAKVNHYFCPLSKDGSKWTMPSTSKTHCSEDHSFCETKQHIDTTGCFYTL